MAETRKVGPFTITLRTEEVKTQVREAALAATQDVFEIDIKAAAKQASPVLTGTNKRSIDTEVTEEPDAVKAELFTQSGYGAYLELGTRKMRAQPYLWPAFQEGIAKVAEKVKEKLNG